MQISRKLLALALIFAVVLAALPSISVAQDETNVDVSSGDASSKASTPVTEVETDGDEYEEEVVEEVVETQQQFLTPSPDVTTTVKFLGITDNKFTAGKEVTALIGLTNNGDKEYNVSYVGAHLHSPYDVNYYVQNFTARSTSGLLPAKSELTVEYKFRPDDKLETLDFHFSGWVIYNDTTAVLYRSLYANHTISMIEKRGEWNVQSALTYLLTLGGLAAAAYFGMQQTATGQKVKKAATAAATSASSDVQTPWTTKAYVPKAGAKKQAKK